MKILFLMHQAFDPFSGGVQMSTFKLSKKFTEMGMTTSVYSFSNTGHSKAEYTKLFHSENKGIHYNKENRDHLYQILSDVKPDIIIDQMPYETQVHDVLIRSKNEFGSILLACLRNSLFSIKLNIEDYIKIFIPSPLNRLFHNFLGRFVFQQVHKSKHAKSLKTILDVYDKFVMFGEPNNDEIKYFIGNYKQSKLTYIPNSIPEVLTEMPVKEKKILWLSRLSYKQKQAQYILPVWDIVHKNLPDWQLDIVGDGDAFKAIQNEILEKNIPRVHLHGKQKANEYFREAPIYFMTSSYEGFPNTVIEAQSFGSIPVIFNSYPIANWVINDNQDGILIKSFEVKKMADAIVKLAKDSEKMRTMGNYALKNANKFHIDVVGEMWRELFITLQDNNHKDLS